MIEQAEYRGIIILYRRCVRTLCATCSTVLCRSRRKDARHTIELVLSVYIRLYLHVHIAVRSFVHTIPPSPDNNLLKLKKQLTITESFHFVHPPRKASTRDFPHQRPTLTCNTPIRSSPRPN